MSTVDTGRTKRDMFVQPTERVVAYCNGVDANRVLDLATATAYNLGLASPTSPVALTDPNAGALTGTFRYRVRWVDATTDTLSLAGPDAAITTAAKKVIATLDMSDAPPTRATHWILERTASFGTVFYPVNVDAGHAYGTPVSVGFYEDNLSDSEVLSAQDSIPNTQGVPPPMNFMAPNMGRLFGGGASPTTVQAIWTHDSILVAGFFFGEQWIGRQLLAAGDTAPGYLVVGIETAALRLDRVYSGTTGTKTTAVLWPRNVGRWSEALQPEAWGEPTLGALSNEEEIGDAEPLIGGVGLGMPGFLWAKESYLFLHRYSGDPSTLAGAQIVQLPVRRGCLNPNAIKAINGVVYGMDQFGIWRYAPGGVPQEIGDALRYDWQRDRLNWAKQGNWFIQWDPFSRRVVFWVCAGSDVYPRLGYVWDLTRETWVDTLGGQVGRACACELKDSEGHLRPALWQAALTDTKAYLYFDGIGTTTGVIPTNTALHGTVQSGTQFAVTKVPVLGQVWVADSLRGAPATLIRPSTGARYRTTIEGNSATVIDVDDWGTVAQAGDLWEIGPVNWVYRSGRLDCGYPEREKCFTSLTIKAKQKTAGCAVFMARVYFDGRSQYNQAAIVCTVSSSQNGVAVTAGLPDAQIDTTGGFTRFRVPLGQSWANDIQVELWGSQPGPPPEILAPLEIEFDVDDAATPRLGPTR